MWSVCYCGILSLQLTTASLNYNPLQWLFGETTICFWLFDLVFQFFLNMNIFRIKPSGGQGGPGSSLAGAFHLLWLWSTFSKSCKSSRHCNDFWGCSI